MTSMPTKFAIATLCCVATGAWATEFGNVLSSTPVVASVTSSTTPEVYAGGRSEEIMGQALRKLAWPRLNYVVSTKFFWGLERQGEGVNRRNTLNRKYLMQAIDGSLRRFGLEHVDLVYCHRPDPATPVEETMWAMSDMIRQGKALYWGTSEWSADEIRSAWEIADRHHLHKPVVEQPQYHLFCRRRVEQEYARLYDDLGLGLTTWSPLASGLLQWAEAGPPARRAQGRRARRDLVSEAAGMSGEGGNRSRKDEHVEICRSEPCSPRAATGTTWRWSTPPSRSSTSATSTFL